jgi:hypothetical protein
VPFFSELQSKELGGDRRIRTDDPRLAKAVLSQLSYIPTSTPPEKLYGDRWT